MKLATIELHNFLSHADTRFEPNGARLLSVVGSNGAGKSALLDGVLYSLFDAARAKTDQLVRLGQTDMSAAVTFDYAGATYRVVRGRTTKAGGRTYLEFAIANGDGWTPLTGDDIRATQARIEELLGLDATTFTSAAFLRQGEADAFVSATPGDRKRVLSQALGLEIYAAAEARARELVRDLEATTSADLARLERLTDEVGSAREGLDAELEQGREGLAIAETEIATSTTEREGHEARMRELEATIAAARAVREQVASLEREKAETGEACRRAKARIATAEAAIVELDRVTAGGLEVAAAAVELPTAQSELDRLLAVESTDRALMAEIETKRQAIEVIDKAYSDAVLTHRTRYALARDRVEELLAGVNALEPVVCEKCQHPNVVDQAGLRPALDAARGEFRTLEGTEPKAPAGLLRDRAALERLEARRRASAFDPGALAAAHRKVTTLSSVAARSEAIDAAIAQAERERRTIAGARSELTAISDRGVALARQITALQERLGDVAAAEAAWLSARNDAAAVAARITQLEATRRGIERAIAAGETRLAQLEAMAIEAAALEATLRDADVELARLRRLVQAFGVTGIPARIITGVLPELASHANELLGELRPGMTLELRAQRAKKDGKGVVEALDLVVRDAAGERPLALFSGGERMSCSLALAVALSRLVARRAGARIESLVVDEPDGLDANARRAFGQALRVIAHRGDLSRVLVVSHHDDLAEFADEIYEVRKEAGSSVVTQLA